MERVMRKMEPRLAVTTISVSYRFREGYHIFTSKDVRGLHVASKDARKAYESVSEVLRELVQREAGVEVEIVQVLSFDEWMGDIRNEDNVDTPNSPTLSDRRFLVRPAAA